MDAPTFFAMLSALAVIIYVLADGFDLGVGILFLAAPRDTDRDIMMASLEPVWDGNETWLVLGGTLLWAAFPPAYYVLLPAFYLPLMLMLFALVLRGISFAFRLQATRFRRVWDYAFAGGSFVAAFMQGLVLGGIIGGVRMQAGVFAGGPFDVFSVLGMLCGVGVVSGYALLGAGWLVWKAEGPTQVFGREIGRVALLLTGAMMFLVSAWTALSDAAVAARWFSWPNLAFLAPVPLITGLVAYALWHSLWSTHETRAFRLAILMFLLGFIGLAISLWPYVIPQQVTIWSGAADPQTLWFAGVGLVIVMPVVLAYQAYAYWVFRGKTGAETSGNTVRPFQTSPASSNPPSLPLG